MDYPEELQRMLSRNSEGYRLSSDSDSDDNIYQSDLYRPISNYTYTYISPATFNAYQRPPPSWCKRWGHVVYHIIGVLLTLLLLAILLGTRVGYSSVYTHSECQPICDQTQWLDSHLLSYWDKVYRVVTGGPIYNKDGNNYPYQNTWTLYILLTPVYLLGLFLSTVLFYSFFLCKAWIEH